MAREPLAAPSAKIVVPDPVSAGRGVNEAPVARINRDVVYPPVLRKEHQIPDGERAHRWIDRNPRSRHLARCPRQVDTLLTVYVLDEPGTIETSAWGSSSVSV